MNSMMTSSSIKTFWNKKKTIPIFTIRWHKDKKNKKQNILTIDIYNQKKKTTYLALGFVELPPWS